MARFRLFSANRNKWKPEICREKRWNKSAQTRIYMLDTETEAEAEAATATAFCMVLIQVVSFRWNKNCKVNFQIVLASKHTRTPTPTLPPARPVPFTHEHVGFVSDYVVRTLYACTRLFAHGKNENAKWSKFSIEWTIPWVWIKWRKVKEKERMAIRKAAHRLTEKSTCIHYNMTKN